MAFDDQKAGERQRQKYPFLSEKYADQNGTPIMRQDLEYQLPTKSKRKSTAATGSEMEMETETEKGIGTGIGAVSTGIMSTSESQEGTEEPELGPWVPQTMDLMGTTEVCKVDVSAAGWHATQATQARQVPTLDIAQEEQGEQGDCKTNNGNQLLSVFPSDHFGLTATFWCRP